MRPIYAKGTRKHVLYALDKEGRGLKGLGKKGLKGKEGVKRPKRSSDDYFSPAQF